MIKVLIVDDEEVIRTGIKLSIDWPALGMEIVGEAANGREGLQLALDLKPQIVIADIRMPIMDGLEFARLLKEKDPAVRIVIISGYDDFTYARKAIHVGVNEYLLKPIGADELIQNMQKQRDEIITGTFIHIRDVDKSQINTSMFYPAEHEKDILAGLRVMDRQRICQILDSMAAYLRTTVADHAVIRNIVLRLLTASICQMEELGVNIRQAQGFADPLADIGKYETLDDYVSWLKTVYAGFIQVMDQTKSDRYRYIVQTAIQYMEKHYNEEIHVKKLAALTCVTPNYFSRIFNQETGKTFSDMLNEIRLEKARQLLDECGVKVYEVAERVGYNNYKSFCLNFKKHTLYTPKAYMNRKRT